jgi:hypothetical protein
MIVPAAGQRRPPLPFRLLLRLNDRQTILSRLVSQAQHTLPGTTIHVITRTGDHIRHRWVEQHVLPEQRDPTLIRTLAHLQPVFASACASARRVLIVPEDIVLAGGVLDELTKEQGSALLLEPFSFARQAEVGANVCAGMALYLSYTFATKWSQVVLLEGRELAHFTHLLDQPRQHRKLLFELINVVLDEGGKFRAVCPKEGFVEIDTPDDLLPARQFAGRTM